MKRYLFVANWKMNAMSPRDISLYIKTIAKITRTVKNADVVIAPPFPYFTNFKGTKLGIAAQNMFWADWGSFTGEVSSEMLRGFGVKHVIIGHSERRMHLGETNLMVNKKVKQALIRGLRPIICVGEERRDQDGAFFATIREQVVSALAKVPRNLASRVTIAYEPVWAIGSGKPARPEDANEAALFIKKIFATSYGIPAARLLRVIYGGSVNAKNAGAFLAEREVSGFLVGRESLSAKSFSDIIQCAKIV